MRAISYTAVRRNLAQTMEQICDDHNPVIITRKSKDSVIMISVEDYEAMQETAYLLQSPANAQRLLKSIEQLDSGNGLEQGLLE